MCDGRFRLYKHGPINELTDKYDEQFEDPSKKDFLKNYIEDDFLLPNKSREFLMNGNSALITIWDSVFQDVPKSLMMSCDIHAVLDDHVQLYYGYSLANYYLNIQP